MTLSVARRQSSTRALINSRGKSPKMGRILRRDILVCCVLRVPLPVFNLWLFPLLIYTSRYDVIEFPVLILFTVEMDVIFVRC